jgi:hypothetical protein
MLRSSDVAVGRHVPPSADSLPQFMARFQEAYASNQLADEVSRGRVPELTGYRETMARKVVSKLIDLGLLV